jgi:hypothetical protein
VIKIIITRYKIQDTGESRFHGEREREKDSREGDAAASEAAVTLGAVEAARRLRSA